MTARLALSATLLLALAACGRSDPADVEAEPDTVELPAERALAEIEDAPVMVAPEPAEPEPLAPAAPDADAARDAGADAQDVAARAQAAAAAAAAAGSAVNLDDEAGEPVR